MKKLIEYFIHNSIVVNLITIMVILLGLFSIFTLNKETFPNVEFDFIVVRTNYPGSSAEDVEKLVTIELERKISEVSGIKEMNGISGEGYSVISLQVSPDYDLNQVLNDVQAAVNGVQNLPDDAFKPVVSKINNKNRPIVKVALLLNDEWKLKSIAKELRDILEKNKSIVSADIEGARSEIVDIEVDFNKLDRYELTLSEVTQAIQDRNISLSAGSIKTSAKEINVRTVSRINKAEDIGEIVIRSNNAGNNVKVSDIAKVTAALADQTRIERANGKRAVFLRVVANANADVLETTEYVEQKTEEFIQKTNAQIEINKIDHSYLDKLAFWVKRRLGVLTQNGLQGMLLVFGCLMLFLNFRISVVTSLGAPLAFLVAFMAMDAIGLSVNLISMFGLILVLGMLVDDSIIVAEQFYQYLEQGMSRRKAAYKAAVDTVAPVTSTILTTIVAFGTLFFLGGIMGKFLWPVPAVVIICLLASWFECFFILPGHLADFVKLRKEGATKERWYQPLMNHYKKVLTFGLKHYKKTITFFLGLFVASIALFVMTMSFELFPGDGVTTVTVNIKGPIGTTLVQTEQKMMEMEQTVMGALKSEEVQDLRSTVGFQRSDDGNSRSGSHYGSFWIYLTPDNERDRDTDEIIKVINDTMDNVKGSFEINVARRSSGPPKGKAINVEISGESLSELLSVSQAAQQEIEKMSGVLSTELDFETGKSEFAIKIDEVEARRLGINNADVAREVRAAFEGLIATEIRRSDEDIDVIVRLDKSYRENPATLENLYVLNNRGQRIKLTNFAKINEQPSAFVIRRFDRKRTFAILGEIDREKTTVLELSAEIEKFMDEFIKDKENLSYRIAGENEDTQESLDNFKKAALMACFLIFIILVLQFSSLAQPLIIMSAIPLGLIGVILIFKLFGMPLSFMALMGVIGLVGVVVNDSIVLVSFMNKEVQQNQESYNEAIVNSALSRFRPVILTTFTTVVGLLPIAHAPGGDPFLKPMAISFAYGILFSTTLTLLFVPCVYLAFAKWKYKNV